MARAVNGENEWEGKEELIVGEFGKRMGAEEWSMGEEALLKERRVTGRESTTIAWVSKNYIALDLSWSHPVPADQLVLALRGKTRGKE